MSITLTNRCRCNRTYMRGGKEYRCTEIEGHHGGRNGTPCRIVMDRIPEYIFETPEISDDVVIVAR